MLNVRKVSEANLEKEEELVKARGLEYAHSPIVAGPDGIDGKNVRAAAEALHGLAQPAFIHCMSGGRASAVVLAHNKIYSGSPATIEEFVSSAASAGFAYNPNWQKSLKEEFFQ